MTKYKVVLRLKPGYAEAHNNLGLALQDKGQLEEAIAQFKEALHLKSDYAGAHCNLGLALQQQGRFVDGLAALRRGHDLGSKSPGWSYPSAQWVREAEWLVALDGKLLKILKGEIQPADAAGGLALARLCQMYKKRYQAAARLYTEAFAAQPQLAEDLQTLDRYNAACAAALAACGQGVDSTNLDEASRASLRRQALEWLRADLTAYRQLLKKEPNKAWPAMRQTMQDWQQDTDFASVRDPEALARLPQAERKNWQQLWADVAETRARAEGKAAPEKKSAPK
jgi:serine/threonine-protein kinase